MGRRRAAGPGIELALHSLARRLKQSRLHDYFARQAGVDIDQAGLAVLYVLHGEKTALRITDLAGRLSIDAPAVTRKAQQLERLGLVSRAKDADDARACRLRLTPEGRRWSGNSCSPATAGSPGCWLAGRRPSAASSRG